MSKIASTEIGAVVNGVKLTAIISPALDAWGAETNARFGQKGKGQADIDLRRDGTSPFWNVPFSLLGKTH